MIPPLSCKHILFLAFALVSQTATAQLELDFYTGQALFEKNWIPAPASTGASDGLGPYYNARSCAQCHPGGGSGSREVSLVLHIDDPVYGEQLQRYAVPGLKPESAGAYQAPGFEPGLLQYGPMQNPAVSPRVAPSLHGLALLESVPETEILAMADPDDLDGDGISGRVNRIAGDSGGEVVGRFGWKAAQPTLETQVARALSLDLGLGNPLRPSAWGDCSAAQVACLEYPSGNTPGHSGLEADAVVPALLLTYIRGLDAPAGVSSGDAGASERGRQLFMQIGCANCHVPEIKSGSGVLHPYTDLLLHDMGPGLADDLVEGQAVGSEWRTPPLWGLGRRNGDFLHDGRAASPAEAISWHDGEARSASEGYAQLNSADRSDLSAFLNSL